MQDPRNTTQRTKTRSDRWYRPRRAGTSGHLSHMLDLPMETVLWQTRDGGSKEYKRHISEQIRLPTTPPSPAPPAPLPLQRLHHSSLCSTPTTTPSPALPALLPLQHPHHPSLFSTPHHPSLCFCSAKVPWNTK